MLLAADAYIEPDAAGIGQGREHRHLVIAKQDFGILAIARVSEAADTERAIVDQVAEEDRSPFLGRVRLERGEKTLEVAVDVADDQDRQIDRSHSSPGPSIRRTARV